MPALPFSLSIDFGKLVNESIRTRGPVNSNGWYSASVDS
ncbi:hypothetical protein GA0115241_10021, partial [Streptomyces sp. DpondAA-D4]